MSSHSHDFSDSEWPFAVAVNTTAFTTKRVVYDNYPVLLVTHDDDGSWQILCATTNAMEDCVIACLGCTFQHNRSIGELADLPLGWQAWRESEDAPWQRAQMEPDEEDEDEE